MLSTPSRYTYSAVRINALTNFWRNDRFYCREGVGAGGFGVIVYGLRIGLPKPGQEQQDVLKIDNAIAVVIAKAIGAGAVEVELETGQFFKKD